jgi:hypothetical protein
VTDDERIVAGAFRGDGGMDSLFGATEFGDRVEVPVWWRNATHVDLDGERGNRLQPASQPADVSGLPGRIDEALVPNAHGA